MWQSSIKNGGKIGLKTTWSLGKIIFPITLIVVVLQHTPVLPWLVKLIEPFMRIFGLSGNAAIPLVLGIFLIYICRRFISGFNREGSFYHRCNVVFRTQSFD